MGWRLGAQRTGMQRAVDSGQRVCPGRGGRIPGQTQGHTLAPSVAQAACCRSADPQAPALGLPSLTGLQLPGSPLAATATGPAPVLLDSLLPTRQHTDPRGPSPRQQACTPKGQRLAGSGVCPDLKTPECKGEPHCSEDRCPQSGFSGQPEGVLCCELVRRPPQLRRDWPHC